MLFLKSDKVFISVVNYPNDYDFTRITEFKKFMPNKSSKTTIVIEYPGNDGFPAWPAFDNKNQAIFRMYWHVAENLKKENIYFLGRLAEYKYYDMDDVVKRALDVFEEVGL
jgi:UDP-galactopyranose mutase